MTFEEIFKSRLKELDESMQEMEADCSYRRREYRDACKMLKTYHKMILENPALSKLKDPKIFSNARLFAKVDYVKGNNK
jgi:hypothetical protein